MPTTIFRNIANPQRTTLAHLKDAEALQATVVRPQYAAEVPAVTANPRRTILMDAPGDMAVATGR